MFLVDDSSNMGIPSDGEGHTVSSGAPSEERAVQYGYLDVSDWPVQDVHGGEHVLGGPEAAEEHREQQQEEVVSLEQAELSNVLQGSI